MNRLSKGEKIFPESVGMLILLSGLFVGVGRAQQKPPKTPPAPPKAVAPHVNAPAHSTMSKPSTGNRTSTMATKPGTTRPVTTTGKTGTVGNGTAGRGTVGTNRATGGTNATRPMGKAGSPMAAGRVSGGNMGKGGNVAMARTVNRPAPGRQVSLRGGGTANIRPNGQIRSINRNGMHIDHGLNGTRRIESTHNGARIVTTGKGSGYVQRAYVTRNGHTYVSRTVVVNHVTYTTVYRSYSYHGYCCYYGYHPAYYYGPAYYGWAYNPWPAPVYYGWGWGGAPWYGYYGGYFAPYPVLSLGCVLADGLPDCGKFAGGLPGAGGRQCGCGNAAANDAAAATNNAPPPQSQGGGNDAPAANSGTVTLTPEVKAAIAEEVKAQLAAEQAAAKPAAAAAGQQATTAAAGSEEVPPALDPAQTHLRRRLRSCSVGRWPGMPTHRRRRDHANFRYSR